MKMNVFGNTSLKVSRIGLGLAALGRPGYINLGHGADLNFNYEERLMQTHSWEVLDASYANGVRYFDVARSYGKAEAFLAAWIRERNYQDIVIGSKWGYTYTADWKVEADKHEIKEHSLSVLDRQWKESSELLNKRLHIYHIHSATLESGVLDNQEVLDRLWQLRNSGIIIGLSLSGEQQSETLEKALTIKTGSEYLFQSAQVSWNVLEQSCSAMLTKAASTGMGIIVKEALANGRLTERNQDPACGDKMNVLNTLAEKYNTGIDALCMAFALAQPWASVVLSGASTEKQLLSNLKAESVNMDQKDLTTLSGLAESSAEYWKSRAGLKWN